jgi:hypothetical protein
MVRSEDGDFSRHLNRMRPPAAQPQCRFCLESDASPKNPLMDVCDCRGSGRFIHFKCLRRWALRDPERNGRRCEVCHGTYRIDVLHRMEIIPLESNWARRALFLSNWVSLASYLSFWNLEILWGKDVVPALLDAYPPFLVSMDTLYLAVFLSQWNVRNPVHYWDVFWRGRMPSFLALHILSGILGIYSQNIILGSLVHHLYSLIWAEHVHILFQINERIRLEN